MRGGVHPTFHKEESTRLPIKQLKIPPQLIIPLHQSTSDVSDLIFAVGDKVLKGQALSKLGSIKRDAIIHAPSSGVITDIKEHTLPHPSGMSGLCVFIETDGKDQWVDLEQFNGAETSAATDILKKIELAGIVGLGGAAFPSTVKLAAAGQQNIHTLIINAAECEPYISCDDILMRERASKIVSGINILVELLQVKHCLIGIEDNKPEAIDFLNKAITESGVYSHSGASELDGPTVIKVSVVPTQYPSGDARQLTQLLTGIEIPKGVHAVDSGVLCHNIATAYAVHEAVELGKPLLSRIVTFTGDGLVHPQNVEALIGTPISFIIEQLGGYNTKAERMLMGGPMMGFALPSDELPITKAANCILVSSIEQLQLTSKTQLPEDKQVMPCIRCNQCAQACPVNLLPQQLYWHARAHDFDKVIEHKLSDCIECGACSYVCPSYIPLVDYFRFAKTEIKSQQEAALKAARSRERFEFNAVRKERIKLARDEKRKKHKEALQKKKQEEAALAAQQGDKTTSGTAEVKPVDDVKAAKQDAIKAAMERAKAKKMARDAAKKKDNNQDAV